MSTQEQLKSTSSAFSSLMLSPDRKEGRKGGRKERYRNRKLNLKGRKGREGGREERRKKTPTRFILKNHPGRQKRAACGVEAERESFDSV